MKAKLIAAAVAAALIGGGAAPAPLAPLDFLIGEWTGGGSGAPGAGVGGTTFARELQGRVVVRTNFADYPAGGERAAFRHDDLMVVYVDADGRLKADYFDDEGHVIRYAVQAREGGGVVFVGEAAPGTPRFRLTYAPDADGVVAGTFEIAPPDKPEAFKTYLSWTMRRAPAKK
ncbi:MAG: hypothetical protein ABFD84_14810 [Candidatus Polarisedimenticolia bacterium]|nr:hypothetical protein [bacterium]